MAIESPSLRDVVLQARPDEYLNMPFSAAVPTAPPERGVRRIAAARPLADEIEPKKRRGVRGAGSVNNEPRVDPMPDRVEPCLALLKHKAPSGPDWLYEIKWDGYRLAVHLEDGRTRLLTRGGHDWTDRFPVVSEAARALGGNVILDGEAVVLDDEGRSDFGALQQALGGRGGKRGADAAILYAFDILYHEGRDLRQLELRERRAMLEKLLDGRKGPILLSEEFEGDGQSLFEAACRHGLEGIVGKRRDAPYRPGRNGDWIKIKCVQSESFFIVGYEPSNAGFGGIGRLLLAAYDGSALRYVGGVGTGLTRRSGDTLRKTMDKLKTRRPPVPSKRKNAVWLEPTLIAEIEFRAWTDDGKLRHASYKGLREFQDNAAVYRMGSAEL